MEPEVELPSSAPPSETKDVVAFVQRMREQDVKRVTWEPGKKLEVEYYPPQRAARRGGDEFGE